MSNFHKSKKLDIVIVDMFNDTSRYLGDITPLDNSEFEQNGSDVHPTELQLNKANGCERETPFLHSDIKVVNNDIPTRVLTNAMTLDFLL